MTHNPLEFIVISDTHITEVGRRLFGLDPTERLQAAISHINRNHPSVEFVVVAGDLVNSGSTAEYECLRQSLSELRAPSILLLGNHDGREQFRSVFPEGDDDGAGFVQALRIESKASILTLDTLDEEGDGQGGYLCDRRLAFLGDALRHAPKDRPLLLFQHHPCANVGLPSVDRHGLRNVEEQWSVFQRSGRRPDFLFHGHIHRPICGIWRGIPFHIQRAVNHQVAFDRSAADKIPITLEPPDYALIRLNEDGMVVHQCPFLYDGPVFGSIADFSS